MPTLSDIYEKYITDLLDLIDTNGVTEETMQQLIDSITEKFNRAVNHEIISSLSGEDISIFEERTKKGEDPFTVINELAQTKPDITDKVLVALKDAFETMKKDVQ